MANAPKANAVVGQSGGPTAVINASLAGVIEQAKKYPEIENLYGAVHAVRGMVQDEFVDIKGLDAQMLDRLAGSPSSALGSSRDKPDEEYCKKIFDVFEKRNVHYFFYIGGNDSANTAYIINSLADKVGYDLRAFHVPKTVDNDLLVTDHCPGFGTAGKFVACALMGDDLDNRALPGIKIDVIMGRHAGFLTAASGLGRRRDDDGPHLIYVPERGFSMEKFVGDIEKVYSKLGRCVVAVSEGICDENGTTWAQKIQQDSEKDAHGNIQLSGSGALADYLAGQVKQAGFASRVRADTFGYLQRSFAGFQSEVDAVEARACGRKAVEFAMEYESGSVAMKRTGEGADYGIEYVRTDLANVAEKTKSLPDDFIAADGNDITEAFVKYAAPLVGQLPSNVFLANEPKI